MCFQLYSYDYCIYKEYCLLGYDAMWSGRSVLTFKRNILSLASELKSAPCNQQAEQDSHGKCGSYMDRKGAPRELVEARRRVVLALERTIFAKVEMEEDRRKLTSVTQQGL
jgi:hypothetical protein